MRSRDWLKILALALVVVTGPGLLTAESAGTKVATGDANAEHDGQRDFDFDLGVWKTHSRRLLHPLTGSTTWTEMDGLSVVKPVWGGKANLAEYNADGPAGHVELMALRWYNPTTHEWNIDFATPRVGTLGIPGVGRVENGRMTFYDQEAYNGRAILVRFSIWSITADTAASEQAFSADGGKTWEVNWENQYTRVKEDATQAQ